MATLSEWKAHHILSRAGLAKGIYKHDTTDPLDIADLVDAGDQIILLAEKIKNERALAVLDKSRGPLAETLLEEIDADK